MLSPSAENGQAQRQAVSVEWPTLGLLGLCTLAWVCGVFVLSLWSTGAAILLLALAIALHSSLTHEVLHGHPFRNQWLNEALVWVQPNLAVPYWRFRDTHLAHHMDANLTDPYDDPETNYLDPALWGGLSGVARAIYRFNNTLFGRILLGPLIGQVAFVKADWAQRRTASVALAWLAHIPGVLLVIWLVSLSPLPIWAYLIAAYAGLSVIRIRTFLEHQAHEKTRGRTVIIEGKCPLAWLFLFNSLHVVHHTHPNVPWYDLPRLYARNRETYVRRNEGYVYRSYAQIFRQYFFKAKDPVPHPLWPSKP